jgi:hypothetical protein
MSQRTLFLSRLIGLYCILIALSMMIRRQVIVEAVTVLLQNPSMTQEAAGSSPVAPPFRFNRGSYSLKNFWHSWNSISRSFRLRCQLRSSAFAVTTP